MTTIKLSKNGTIFELAVNGWEKNEEKLKLVVLANNASIEAIEEEFANNETIELQDAGQKTYARGYSLVSSIGITHGYRVGGVDDDGKDITHDVWCITLSRPSIYDTLKETQANIEYIAMMSDIDLKEA